MVLLQLPVARVSMKMYLRLFALLAFRNLPFVLLPEFEHCLCRPNVRLVIKVGACTEICRVELNITTWLVAQWCWITTYSHPSIVTNLLLPVSLKLRMSSGKFLGMCGVPNSLTHALHEEHALSSKSRDPLCHFIKSLFFMEASC
jgi:hypothetical protein